MIEQNKELFKEFIEFCASQPQDKKIDHGEWYTCAVGDFAQHKGVDLIFPRNQFDKFRTSLLGCFYSDLYKRIDCRNCPDTYGPFTEFLRGYL